MNELDRVKEIAKKKGWSLREVEEKAGLSATSLYNWKRSNPKSENVEKVAKALNVSVDYLLGNADEPNGHKTNEGVDLREVMEEERYDLISAGGRPITDEDWEIIKAVLAKYPIKKD